MYIIEQYKDCKRFNGQYMEIYQFLLKVADVGYNEHFHWGRFEWMMIHTLLDEDKLTSIAVFRDKTGEMVGLVTYDTSYNDRAYLLHSISDKELLRNMVNFVVNNEDTTPVVKANSNDIQLCEVLKEQGFVRKNKEESVLQIDLNKDLHYQIPKDYCISSSNFEIDNWKYQLVIHKGFNNDGIPKMWESKFFESTSNYNKILKVFAVNEEEYCAHCGVWYTQGNTAYIEPVVTIPNCRKLGLAKAVVYEALARAKILGAKRAIVLSGQEFYFKIGFNISSDFYAWIKE